jgi:hypothetical protein
MVGMWERGSEFNWVGKQGYLVGKAKALLDIVVNHSSTRMRPVGTQTGQAT